MIGAPDTQECDSLFWPSPKHERVKHKPRVAETHVLLPQLSHWEPMVRESRMGLLLGLGPKSFMPIG